MAVLGQGRRFSCSLLSLARARSGDDALYTIFARGFLAVALARNGKREEAYKYFNDAIPKIVDGITGDGDADSGTTAAAMEGRLRFIVESYCVHH